MDEGLRMALGLALGLVILVLMITKTKIHVFLAVIICSIFIGLFGGMGQEDVIASITKGFGNSLSSIGIIIGFGVMLGHPGDGQHVHQDIWKKQGGGSAGNLRV